MSSYDVSRAYNGHAYDYTTKFFRPWRDNSEAYTVVKRISKHNSLDANCLEGMKILDLACGGGHYAQKYLSLGAERVVGIDITSGLIENAIEFTKQAGYEDDRFAFYIADCGNLEAVEACMANEPVKEFDVVTCIWLLCNASDQTILRKMIQVADAFLKPGGKLIHITANPFSFYRSPEVFKVIEEYGLIYERTGDLNGVPMRRVTFLDPDGKYMFDVINYGYSIEQIQDELISFNYQGISYSALEVDSDHERQLSLEFVRFLRDIDQVHAICIEAYKA